MSLGISTRRCPADNQCHPLQCRLLQCIDVAAVLIGDREHRPCQPQPRDLDLVPIVAEISSTQAASKAFPIAQSASGPNDAPSISRFAFIAHPIRDIAFSLVPPEC
jgi:hypothetical protein